MHRRAITLERVRSITMLLVVALVAVAVAVLVDQVVRWPWAVRSVLLLGGLKQYSTGTNEYQYYLGVCSS